MNKLFKLLGICVIFKTCCYCESFTGIKFGVYKDKWYEITSGMCQPCLDKMYRERGGK